MSSSDIFGQLASQDAANQKHDQAAASQNNGDVFSQIAANGGKVPDASTPQQSGEVKNDVGATVIVPKEGEDFYDTIERAKQRVQQKPQEVQADIAKETTPKNIASKTAQTLVAAPVIGAAGAATIAGAGEAGAMAGRVGQAALQPIKDAIVEELPYLKSSPSLYLEHLANQAVKYVMENPGNIITASGVLGAAAKYLLSKAAL